MEVGRLILREMMLIPQPGSSAQAKKDTTSNQIMKHWQSMKHTYQ